MMPTSFAMTLVRRAKRHVSGTDRYRLYPLYALLLTGVLFAASRWPLDAGTGEMGPAWVHVLGRCAWATGIALTLVLGVTGVLRKSVISKFLSLCAVCAAVYFVAPWLWDPATWSREQFLWYAFDRPASLIERTAAGSASIQAMLWAGYLLVIYLLLRPVLKWLARPFVWFKRAVVDRVPGSRYLSRRIL